ncbi:hypothetical protein [Shewanella vaxholmensis]|uniref:hypothetical protein n=1 Tax=Shewanella vaxholmensis TaxID=3063535 RepID=UPI00288D3706|nr:hypothetical protein [Shewanella sp. SP1S1-4]MDT3306673.1 hypothetical protein [Shewanella sp. SP1S1-4]
MNNITYLNGWDIALLIQLNDDYITRCDMNRLFYKGCPSTQHILEGKPVESANRDEAIIQFKEKFQNKIEEGASHATVGKYFMKLLEFLKWCDKAGIEAFSLQALQAFMAHLFEKVRLGLLKATCYTQTYVKMVKIFSDYLDYPSNWQLTIPTMRRGDSEPFEAYSRSDLKQLLPFLRKLFNQTAEQFLENPQKHINAHKRTSTATFMWQGQRYELNAVISKMMSAALFLISYYTYSNTSTLFKLKRPRNTSTSVSKQWYQMPAFKRRSFKIVHVEIGEHDYIDIPKYCLALFDKLLEVSKVLDDSDDALLFQIISNKKLQPIKPYTLQAFNGGWLEKNFCFTDQTGRRLRPVVSRFRETGAQLTTVYQGELANNITLGNTPNIRRKHYSKGNKHNNNAMMQDVMLIRQEQAQTKQGAYSAQLAVGIDVLTIEEEFKTHFPLISRTPNGGSCTNPFNEKSDSYSLKAKQRNLLKDGEKLACAELLKCFGCPHQVIVQSVNDIWCLLSFKTCIEESIYQHLSTHHYRKNFEMVVSFIRESILPKIRKDILKKAEEKLDDIGLHPLWQDSGTVILPKLSATE